MLDMPNGTAEANGTGEASAFVSLLEHLQDGVCLFDAGQRLVACNERYTEIYRIPATVARPGVTLTEILRFRIAQGSTPAMDAEAYIANRLKAVTDGVEKNEVHELADGRILSVRHKPTPDGGWLTTHTDITEIYQLKSEIEHMAFHDQLTGLANRRLMERSLEEARSESRGEGTVLTYIDLDRFKPVNDRYGHAAGDRVLEQVSQRLRACFRRTDTVARLGGDEFAVLQRGAGSERSIHRLAERAVDALAEPMEIEGERISVGASLGVVHAGRRAFQTERLWKQADTAMYDAKAQGGSRYVLRRYQR